MRRCHKAANAKYVVEWSALEMQFWIVWSESARRLDRDERREGTGCRAKPTS